MPSDRWADRCLAQRVHYLQGEISARVVVVGFVFAKDSLSVYPVGSFELTGDVVVYPPQTLNPTEEESMLGAAMGLARMWDGTGLLTLRFAKQRDGGDFAFITADEDMSAQAKDLLTMRGLWDGEGASFLRPGEKAPELLELPIAGVSADGVLVTADSVKEALLQLPEAARSGVDGWYKKLLRDDG
jgi:hypothetical protein